ncbi:MAG: hypothetical protein Q8S32_18005 [Burkholderiaceae bacterium]|nr:hypothetical protein [Burkholderiaceae bacterium]
MKTIFRPTLLLCVLASLTACGGSDDPPASSALSGLAATGAAIANADVTARCVTGPGLTGQTGTDGVFSLPLSATHTAPCMLEVVNGAAKLYSFATEAGRVNITPATDLVVANALKGNLADAFAGFGKDTADTISTGLVAAKAYVKAQLKLVTGAEYAADPLSDVLAVGDANDKVLDALGSALVKAGKSITDLRAGAVEGKVLTEIVPAPSGGGSGGGDAGGPCSTPSTTLPYAASTAGGPFSNGEQVCFSASTTELTISGVKLTNPTQNTAVSAPYSAYKFVGSSATFEVIFKDTALHEINVSSVDGSTFFGQIAAPAGGGGETPPPNNQNWGSVTIKSTAFSADRTLKPNRLPDFDVENTSSGSGRKLVMSQATDPLNGASSFDSVSVRYVASTGVVLSASAIVVPEPTAPLGSKNYYAVCEYPACSGITVDASAGTVTFADTELKATILSGNSAAARISGTFGLPDWSPRDGTTVTAAQLSACKVKQNLFNAEMIDIACLAGTYVGTDIDGAACTVTIDTIANSFRFKDSAKDNTFALTVSGGYNNLSSYSSSFLQSATMSKPSVPLETISLEVSPDPVAAGRIKVIARNSHGVAATTNTLYNRQCRLDFDSSGS